MSEEKEVDLTPTDWSVPELPERILLDLRTDCNLRCPMCLLHGSDDQEKKANAIGIMDVDQAKQILDEVMNAAPLIQPSMWGEPLLAKNLKEHIQNMKKRGITVCMNTNGLTLKRHLAEFFVEIGLDVICFSVDSTTPETLKKIRGIDKLQKIHDAIALMLQVRQEKQSRYPRIGATFTIQEENKHELDEFVDEWIHKVDLVRVGSVYEDGKITDLEPPKERIPCQALYHTLPIHYNGDASICCFDSFGTETVGNVFKDGGVKAVWHGDKLNQIRHYHETGQWEKVPFCKNCNAWAGYMYKEKITQRAGVDVLERHSFQFIYYNRLDRLENWGDNLKGHKPPVHHKEEETA